MHEKPPIYTFENVQHQGAKKIAIAARENEAQLVHISAIGADPNSEVPYAKTKGNINYVKLALRLSGSHNFTLNCMH